jgi:hypothetical protein
MGTSDPHKSMSSTLHVRLAGGCVVADAVLWVSLVAVTSLCPTRSWLETPGGPPALTFGGQEAVACGLSKTLGPFQFPYSGAVSLQGQFHLLPLVLVVFRGYASIVLLPDQLQASIPSAGLALMPIKFLLILALRLDLHFCQIRCF